MSDAPAAKPALPDVRAMCAIGLRGQLGLRGGLPWEGFASKGGPDAELYRADVARFFDRTRGHVLLAGPATAASVPALVRASRTVVTVRSGDDPAEQLARLAGRVVYIGGGPAVWAAYAPWIRHWDITRLPYDGDADRWFDPQWTVGSAASPSR